MAICLHKEEKIYCTWVEKRAGFFVTDCGSGEVFDPDTVQAANYCPFCKRPIFRKED